MVLHSASMLCLCLLTLRERALKISPKKLSEPIFFESMLFRLYVSDLENSPRSKQFDIFVSYIYQASELLEIVFKKLLPKIDFWPHICFRYGH